VHNYRIFVSYSRDDKELAAALVGHLEEMGFRAVWDRNLRPGDRFSEKIKHGIAHAHVFLPILTDHSATRPWVHQETGYAMGLEVPVLPVSVGIDPGEMTQGLEAMKVEADLSDLRPEAIVRGVEALLVCERPESLATFRCAALPEERAELLGRYTREALGEEGGSGPLRQSGALTSFCLPAEPPPHEVWSRRDDPIQRGDLLHECLHEERLAFEDYAREHGCDLVIDPYLPLPPYSPLAVRTRLETLLAFLEDNTVESVRVVVRSRAASGSLTIVGDWFSAESVAPRPGKGYYQSNFTWHAPTVLRKLRKFDRDFSLLLQRTGTTEEDSRSAATAAVRQAIERVED